MDPLSITAGVIAVGTLTAQVSKAFSHLRKVCKELLDRLHALGNDVTDLSAVIKDVDAIATDPAANVAPADQTSISVTLGSLQSKLPELKEIIHNLSNACEQTRVPLIKARQWSKAQVKLQRLQEEIKTHKSHLNIALSASNSRRLLHIRLDIAALSTGAIASSELQTQLGEALVRNASVMSQFLDANQRTDERLKNLEALVRASGLQINGLHQKHPNGSFITREDAVGVQIRRHSTSCRPCCACACHHSSSTNTPGLLNSLLGQLFIGYSQLPMLRPRCDGGQCARPSSMYVKFEYWFPSGVFWSHILRVHCAYQAQLGPQFQISTFRRIPEDAPAVAFALTGKIDKMKDLFTRGLASPRDVSDASAYSLLRWSVCGRQYAMVEFLLKAGADPTFGSAATLKSPLYHTPSDRAQTIMLQRSFTTEEEVGLRLLSHSSDLIDDLELTPIHKAVLRLSSQSVEGAILQHPYDVDTKDQSGRTPLAWAAARGDDQVVEMLLVHGADPNTIEAHGSTPLHNICEGFDPAGDDARTKCCHLLLQAGADPDLPRPPERNPGTPLYNACLEGGHIAIFKALIDHGADPDGTAFNGRTALHHTARRDDPELMMLLLDAGACINAESYQGETPFSMAVVNNSHRVLRLLLHHFSACSVPSHLKGSILLESIAAFANEETMEVLMAADHLPIEHDIKYSLSYHIKTLRTRVDASESLAETFQRLLVVINEQAPPLYESDEGLLEAGQQLRPRAVSNTSNTDSACCIPGSWPEEDEKAEEVLSEDEDEAFEEALSTILNPE